MQKSKMSAAGAGFVIAAALIATGGASANAADFDPLEVVQSQGLLASGQTGSGAQTLESAEAFKSAAASGEATAEPSTISPVSISPLTGTEGVYDASADATVVTESNYGVVTGTGVENTSASFVVIRDASAPTAYDFKIGGPGTSLALREDGSVVVSDASGQAVNYLIAPWAKDANGVDVPTHYTVSGNVVTQHVDITGAAFPVVADPTTGCGVGWCSVYFNREETKAIAAGGPTGAGALTAGCALINPIAGAGCAIAGGAVAAVALGADANGNCVGIVGYGVGTLGGWNPFVENKGSSHCP